MWEFVSVCLELNLEFLVVSRFNLCKRQFFFLLSNNIIDVIITEFVRRHMLDLKPRSINLMIQVQFYSSFYGMIGIVLNDTPIG